MTQEIPEYPPVCQLKITLSDIKPPIWRRIFERFDPAKVNRLLGKIS